LLLYYITDRTEFPGTESQRRERLQKKIAEAALAGVDYVQLREKDLPARELESVSREVAQLIHQSGSRTRLLINSRTDVALSAQADGVHLTSHDVSPLEVGKIWREAQGPGKPVIAVSCHSDADVVQAESASADFVVFGPVFEKRGTEKVSGVGMDHLRKASQHRIPVLALGSVTVENARQCLEAGASGVAGIRMFQDNDVASVVTELRRLK
jgi:thiamine-phosphate pyrophosphorylase